jgi:hypothetical protein
MNSKLLAPGIIEYKNVIPNYDRLMNLLDDESVSWNDALIVASRDPKEDPTSIEPKLNRDIRNCGSIAMPYDKYEMQSFIPNERMRDVYFEMHDIIKPVFTHYEDEYMQEFKINVRSWHSRLEFLRYDVGQFFEDHIDTVPGITRTVSAVLYLNDDYEGGEIYFSRFDLKIKPEKNSLILFPSNYVYNHSAEPVKKGTKYAIATFLA